MGKLSQERHSTGGLNKWSIELTRLSQRSVAVSHSIIRIAVSYGNSTAPRPHSLTDPSVTNHIYHRLIEEV